MALVDDAYEDWLLLKSVQPVFASKIPSVSPAPPAGSVLEDVLWNFETMFEFEMLQASDIIPKAEVLALSANLTQHIVTALRSLLQLLEQHIGTQVIDFLPTTDCNLPKLKALQFELARRHVNFSGSPLDHAEELNHLVWLDMTLEGFRDIVKKLQDFNQSANQVVSSTLREEQPPSASNIWNDKEIQSVLEAGQTWKSLDRIFESLVGALSSCRLPHDAMIHLSDPNNIKMLLASCSPPRAWRRTVCSVILNQE
ncbi:hypothetical protein A1O3_00312 [Capronia epimyces CBS 606.96]|uniref:DUF7580 domain-containing protein n=1 Tax=Capronia epimyces CBS 606.96 TaxID=1182542 RepID=W9YFU4_9EURO|nr:uncharacterized protein A1O3_00312 [Capronia epimyces CBS 606.96]EXJ91762.1 hypothetical protein A1O3_00312 [Capronia epimyces CBS 606.96]